MNLACWSFSPRSSQLGLQTAEFGSVSGQLTFAAARAEVNATDLTWKTKASGWQADSGRLRLDLSLGKAGLLVRLTNTGRTALRLEQVRLSLPPAAFKPALAVDDYTQLYFSEVPLQSAGVRALNRGQSSETAVPSHTVTVLSAPEGGPALLLGALGQGDCGVSLHLMHDSPHHQGNFGLELRADFRCELAAGQSQALPELVALSGTDPLALLAEYGRLWRARVKPRPARPVRGWNSWDFYGGAVAQADMLTQADRMRADFPELTHAVMDDGWQVRWGEWTAHERFPAGLPGLVKELRARGRVPGIWIAPYTMYMHCPFAFKNRDCLVHDATGNIVLHRYSSGPVALLDPTHPQVARYITDTFRALRRAGFEYFKLDFTQALLDPAAVKFHDPTLSRQAICARALELIRRAVGKAYILCGTFPFAVLAGQVEAARISNDIHIYWSHVIHGAKQVAACHWMHDNLYRNDPDFLVVRSATTSRDPHPNYINQVQPVGLGEWWVRGRTATAEELQVWASVVLLSGGDLLCGDNLATLNARGRGLIRTCLEHICDQAAEPLDLFSAARADLPPAFWLGRQGKDVLLGVINWTDTPDRLCPPAAALPAVGSGIREIWSGRAVSAEQLAQVELPARSAQVYRFARAR